MVRKGTTNNVFRLLLLGATVCYTVAVAWHLQVERVLAYQTPDNLARGIRWNFGNPLLWSAYARSLLFSPEGFQPERATDAYLRAAAMNPFDPDNWEGLATAYQQVGDNRKAEQALRAGLMAVPRSPPAAWRLANFLLLQGRRDEALPYLRIAAASDPRLRPAVFDLAWKILDQPEAILREVVPEDLSSRSAYLVFLRGRGKLLEAYSVWNEIRQGRAPTAFSDGCAYIDALAHAGLGQEAARVWQEILEDTGRTAAKPAGELMTNGDFEAELPNAGLDWRLVSGPGYEIALDNFVLQQGSRSLQVAFDGTANQDFMGVWQWVPVEPNREYRFRGYIKTENISTESGVRFSIASFQAPAAEHFVHYTENRLGTDAWMLERLDFKTGPNTRVLQVALRRLPSQKLDNLLRGKVWIDNLSIQPLR